MKREDVAKHLDSVNKFLLDELLQVRTGRATSTLVDTIEISAYEGSDPLPLNELATVSAMDAQTLVISPWDKSILDKVEVAIRASGRGLNPVNDGESIRVNIPALTEDRRKEMVKEISLKVENAKIRIRTIRQNAIKAIDEQEENGVISEDEMHRQKKLLEEDITRANQKLVDLGKKKEEEVMKV